MSINVHLPAKSELLKPTITVVGVGGAGGNAVNNMISSSLEGVNFVVANTDAQALDHALTERSIQLGAGITKGLGAGANPEVGRAAAEEAADEVAAAIDGSNMVFITAGMGGGTGTGAAPVVARLAREQGILTVAVVTKPFQFEGSHRMRMAEAGLKELQEYVDTLIIIPNQNLFRIANERTTFADAFKMADEVLHSGVRGITDLMVKPGLINLDFADIRTVMREMGKAMMGTGEATGDRRAIEAAEAAISNPLLDEVSLKGARALLINITGGNDMTLFEVDEAANRVRQEVDADANIIFGSAFNDGMEGRMRVSVVATGIDAQSPQGSRVTEARKPYGYGTPAAAAPIAARAAEAAPAVARAAAPAQPIATASAPRAPEPVKAPAYAAHAPVAAPAPRYQPAVPEVRTAPAAAQEAPAPRTPEPLREAPALALVAEAPAAPVAAPLYAPQPAATYAAPAAPQPVAAQPDPMARAVRVQDAPLTDDLPVRSLFQRIADVSRALSARSEHPEARTMQVVEKPRPDVVRKALPEEEQYLDIPAFLRRQAN